MVTVQNLSRLLEESDLQYSAKLHTIFCTASYLTWQNKFAIHLQRF